MIIIYKGCATSSFCSGWKLMGYCKQTSKHFQWMKVNCPESCGFPCPTTKPSKNCYMFFFFPFKNKFLVKESHLYLYLSYLYKTHR